MPTATESRPDGPVCALVWQRCLFTDSRGAAIADDWTRWVLARAHAHRGRSLVCLGSTVVMAWDAIDCHAAIELCLQLIGRAEQESIELKLGYGVAVGPVAMEQQVVDGRAPVYVGAALDRAQLLSSRARGHEIIVDLQAYERLAERYLFSRESGSGDLRGYSLDVERPHKRACRSTVHSLNPVPISALRKATYEALQRRLGGEHESHLVLRCDSPFEPLDWLQRLTEEHQPPLQLHLRGQAGGLQPLGSLQAALARPPEYAPLQELVRQLPSDAQTGLVAIADGEAVHRAVAVRALGALLSIPGKPPWIVLHRLHDIDAASLGVLAECKAQLKRRPLLIATTPLSASLPEVLFPKSDRLELTLEELPQEERQAIAAAILQIEADSNIARRVAMLSPPSTLGVLETCRTLVAAGDLVPDVKGFRWRMAPRSGQEAMPLEILIAERMSGAPALAYRMLEVLSVATSGCTAELIQGIAQRDGLSLEDAERGLSILYDEGFIDRGLSFGAREAVIRATVRSTMPPPRSAELHRFAAQWLSAELARVNTDGGFARAQLAHHLSEGGMLEQAAATLLDAAEMALKCGFQRLSVRLAANAIQLDGATALRERARRMMRQVEDSRTSAAAAAQPNGREKAAIAATANPVTPTHAQHAADQEVARKSMQAALNAMGTRDLDTVQRHLDTAVTAGFSRAAVRRIHAMALLARKDIDGALLALQQPQDARLSTGERARQELAYALVMLESGRPSRAVRAALLSLQLCREQGDARGDYASRLVISACYRALGQPTAAARLEASP